MLKQLLILLPLAPFIGFICNICLGSKSPRRLVSAIAILSILISFAGSMWLTIELGKTAHFLRTAVYFPWINIASLDVAFELFIDPLSSVMLIVVTGVGLLVHIYSIGYMRGDSAYNRYFAYLNLFVAFMIILVTGGNLLVTFIGWEGVGLASYLLIGFWFNKEEYTRAASKAFILNRIGDAGLLLAMFLLLYVFHTLNFVDLSILFALSSFIEMPAWTITIIAVLILFAATGKSAQIPLFTWLPDAMAGPTPVSALMHAATMVTAGIYLILRLNFIFVQAPVALSIMAGLGLATALLAATIACFQVDIKKILAYSTISQLGYMFFALGLGAFSVAFFHLITHAFFKALLFLAAGSLIHAMHTQNLFSFGGLRRYMPVTFVTMVVGGLAIAGIPPFAGFFSKDAILEEAFHISFFVWLVVLFIAILTAYYTFRLIFTIFLGNPKSEMKVHESPASMTVPMVILAALATVAGLINIPKSLHGGAWLSKFVALDFANASPHASASWTGHIPLIALNIIAVLASVLSIYIAYKEARRKALASEVPPSGLSRLAGKAFYVDRFYDALIVHPISLMSRKMPAFVDRFILDGIINGITKSFRELSEKIKYVQSGSVSWYLISMAFFLVLIFFFLNYFLTLIQ